MKSKTNRKIFRALEFDMTSPLAFQIPQGTIGEILNEVVSEQSGKTYCLFKEKDGERIGVINKQAIQPYDPNYYQYYGENYFNDDCNGSISPWYNAIDVHVGMITKSRNPITGKSQPVPRHSKLIFCCSLPVIL